jgi:hypothetical protein
MLIATQYGLYSILPSGPEVFQIRGGCRRDLEQLLALTDVEVPIQTAEASGSLCWIEVDLDEAFEVMTQLSFHSGCCDFKVEQVGEEGSGGSFYTYKACFGSAS